MPKKTQTKIVPMTNSADCGILIPVCHLPRMWSKLLLAATGKLPGNYSHCGKGFEAIVLSGLGLDRSAVIRFMNNRKATYVQFERWILQQSGVRTDARTIAKLNEAILGYKHADGTRREILHLAGLSNADRVPYDACTLNLLDGLTDFHHRLVPPHKSKKQRATLPMAPPTAENSSTPDATSVPIESSASTRGDGTTTQGVETTPTPAETESPAPAGNSAVTSETVSDSPAPPADTEEVVKVPEQIGPPIPTTPTETEHAEEPVLTPA